MAARNTCTDLQKYLKIIWAWQENICACTFLDSHYHNADVYRYTGVLACTGFHRSSDSENTCDDVSDLLWSSIKHRIYATANDLRRVRLILDGCKKYLYWSTKILENCLSIARKYLRMCRKDLLNTWWRQEILVLIYKNTWKLFEHDKKIFAHVHS